MVRLLQLQLILIITVSFLNPCFAQKYYSQESTNIEFRKHKWRLVFVAEAGFGEGSGGDIGFGTNSRYTFSADVISLAFGFPSLGGIGFGSMIFEGMWGGAARSSTKGTKSTMDGMPSSFLPIYIYYPLFVKIKSERHPSSKGARVFGNYLASPIVYAFAGGSAWGTSNDYFHVGLAYLSSVGSSGTSGGPRIIPLGNWGFRAGLFYSSSYSGKNNISINDRFGFYLTLNLGLGRIVSMPRLKQKGTQ